MTVIIFKTKANTLSAVVKHAKHALTSMPNLAPGDTILIAQTLQTIERGDKQIRYRMNFVRTYQDQDGETDQKFGRHWRYIIEGEDMKSLRCPFNIADVLPEPHKNYGRGSTTVYLHPSDEETLRRGGYFDVVGDA